jgi:HAMP domain-containing protein
MDAIFILIIVGLYAVTHWVTRALSKLGSVE